MKCKLLLNFATFGPIGNLPASGTVGSLCAMIFVPVFLKLSLWIKLFILLALATAATIASTTAENYFGIKDPKEVIIDEFVGQLTVFLPFTHLNWWQIFAGFLVFRLFDISKPWPIKYCDRSFSQGFGIMIDDIMAGIFTMIVIGIIRAIFS